MINKLSEREVLNMKLLTIGLIALAIVIVVVVAAFAGMAALFMDVMSYTATGSETLNPAGTAVGNALVVYDPGVSGTTKNAAVVIAGDLQSKGYKVDLAGVRSAAAANVSGYDVIIVGGPTYAGNIASSIAAYLKSLNAPTGATIGLFATGSVEPASDDPVYMRKFVSGLPDDSLLKITSAVKLLPKDDTDKKCAVYVTGLLQ